MLRAFLAILLFSLWAKPLRADQLQEWYDEALRQGKDALLWQYHQCPQLLVLFKSWSESVRRPPLILHSSNSKRGLQVAEVHWSALSRFPQLQRDIYFLVTCEGDSLAAMLQILAKPDEGFDPKFSAVEKAEHAKLRSLFPKFKDASFVWSEGPFLDATTIEPWIWAPLGTSQRGVWLVKLETDDNFVASAAGRILFELQEDVRPKRWRMSELHYEHEREFEEFRRFLPLKSRLLSILNPREFFFARGWEDELAGRWSFVSARDSEVVLQFEFMGGRDQEEVEADLRRILKAHQAPQQIRYQSIYFRPFIRSPFYGREMESFEDVLRHIPQVKPVPFVAWSDSASYLFRKWGFSTLEFSGLYSRHRFRDRKSHEDFNAAKLEAIELHTKIISELSSR